MCLNGANSKRTQRKLRARGPSPDWVSLPVLSPPRTVLWIRGSPRGPLTLTLPKTLSTHQPGFGQRPPPWPCSPGRREEEAGRALCLLWSPFTGPFLPRPSDGAVWLGWRSKARWRLRGCSQSQEAGTPQEHVATACPSPKGQRRVTQGWASLDCPKLEASHTWACLWGGGLT